MLYATPEINSKDDLAKPQIGIASVWYVCYDASAGWAKIKFQLFLGFEGKSRMGIHSIIILFSPSSLQLALNVGFRWCLHHAGVGAGVGAAYVTCVPIMLRLWVGLIGVRGWWF